jgi:predicted O-methyltransferase YrrM
MKAIERTGVEYYCQVSDVELIKKIVRELPDNPVCINIGAGMGTSALAMLEARQDSTVYSIDKDIDSISYERNIIRDAELEFRYNGILNLSQLVGVKWVEYSADFVFVDGGHTYEECYDDALVWYKALKYNGIMAFHDYESRIKVLESVKRAVDDVVKVLNLKFVVRRGTMIVFRKVAEDG